VQKNRAQVSEEELK